LIFKIAAFVIPLGFDTFSVAVMLGLHGKRPLQPALTFAFFEAVMPIVGLLLGRLVGARFEMPAAVFGGVALVGMAICMLREILEGEGEGEGEASKLAFTSIRATILAGFGISLDELAIGFPMGVSGLPIPETIAAIALQAFIVTYAGIVAGARFGTALGRRTSKLARVVAAAAFGVLGVYLITQPFLPGLPEI
jgi:manganese efflux pump family protein